MVTHQLQVERRTAKVRRRKTDVLPLLHTAVDITLSIIDVHRPHKVYVDASDHTVAGILAQQDDNGHDLPVAFASVKLNPVKLSQEIRILIICEMCEMNESDQ